MSRSGKITGIFSLVILSAFVSGCGVQTATYGTGESVELGLVKDLAGLASFGKFGRAKPKGISYRERASLVVPSPEQQASIPEPIDTIDQVDDSFPERAAEIARVEEKKERKKGSTEIVNSFLGIARAQPLGSQKPFEKETEGDVTQQENARVGTTVPIDVRELTKTPEEIAKERGITVAELPESLRSGPVNGRNILERAGLVDKKRRVNSQSLTDVPIEYRTVQQTATDKEAEALISAKKKKKKKKFLFF